MQAEKIVKNLNQKFFYAKLKKTGYGVRAYGEL